MVLSLTIALVIEGYMIAQWLHNQIYQRSTRASLKDRYKRMVGFQSFLLLQMKIFQCLFKFVFEVFGYLLSCISVLTAQSSLTPMSPCYSALDVINPSK